MYKTTGKPALRSAPAEPPAYPDSWRAAGQTEQFFASDPFSMRDAHPWAGLILMIASAAAVVAFFWFLL